MRCLSRLQSYNGSAGKMVRCDKSNTFNENFSTDGLHPKYNKFGCIYPGTSSYTSVPKYLACSPFLHWGYCSVIFFHIPNTKHTDLSCRVAFWHVTSFQKNTGPNGNMTWTRFSYTRICQNVNFRWSHFRKFVNITTYPFQCIIPLYIYRLPERTEDCIAADIRRDNKIIGHQ